MAIRFPKLTQRRPCYLLPRRPADRNPHPHPFVSRAPSPRCTHHRDSPTTRVPNPLCEQPEMQSIATVNANDLLAALADATGPDDFPACMRMAADTLCDLARTRFSNSPALVQICTALHDSHAAEAVRGVRQNFTDEDATIIAFFLARNTTRTHLKCVLGREGLPTVGRGGAGL